MTNKILSLLIAICALLAFASSSEAQNDLFGAKGLHPRQSYSSVLPFEHIDIATGSLVLTFTDLVLPGNAGRELRLQRTYNSKELAGSGQWSFGIAGVPMTVFDELWPSAPANGSPAFTMADGGTRTAGFEVVAAAGLRYMGTDTFWVYDRETRVLRMPDGTTCVFDAQGRLSYFSDPFSNTVELLYAYPAQGKVTIRQGLGQGQVRDIEVTLGAAALPTAMTFLGRTWSYDSTSATLPEGVQWQFTPLFCGAP